MAASCCCLGCWVIEIVGGGEGSWTWIFGSLVDGNWRFEEGGSDITRVRLGCLTILDDSKDFRFAIWNEKRL
jgi:hypothetical protein